MEAEFYDVKAKAKVKATVTEKVFFEKNNRYAFKAKTEDGRNLTRFVSKADYDAAEVNDAKPAKKCASKKGAGKKGSAK